MAFNQEICITVVDKPATGSLRKFLPKICLNVASPSAKFSARHVYLEGCFFIRSLEN